jgi:hypothetical protein
MTNETPEESKEARILRVMRLVLAAVIKDTATPPGMRHPLSETTIEDIRQCLALIAAREREIAHGEGRTQELRPHFADEQQKKVAVPIGEIGKPKKKDGN